MVDPCSERTMLSVLRGFVSGYSHNEVAEPLRRFLGPGASAACVVTDIRHRPGAEIWRPRWCPAREDEFAALGGAGGDRRRRVSGNIAGKSCRLSVRFALIGLASDVLGRRTGTILCLSALARRQSLRATVFFIRSC